MPQLFTNNARALLASGINESATTITIEAGKADLFPVANVGSGSLPSANNWFKATLQDSSGNVEIVYVRTRTAGSGVLGNVIRAQEGTTARAFNAGSVVGLRVTSADIQQSVNILATNNTFIGANTFAGVVTFNQTIEGNAATVTNGVYTVGTQTIGGNKTFAETVLFQDSNHLIALTSENAIHQLDFEDYWNFARSTNTLTWVRGGVARATFASNGDFTASGDVTAYSDVRLKRDLHVIEHALHKLQRLTGYTYTRIDTGKRQTGLIAQDVQRVLPEAVAEGEHLSVAYGNLMGLVVEAVKELANRVENLEG